MQLRIIVIQELVGILTQSIISWIDEGDIIPLIGLWVLLGETNIRIQRTLVRLIHREYLLQSPFPRFHDRWFYKFTPSFQLIAILPSFEMRGTIGYVYKGTGWTVFAQQVLITTVGVLFEEVLARGGPLYLAQQLGLPAWWFIAIGTVHWAFLHGTGRGFALILTVGWFLAALTLAGHWPLAIGLHLGNNLAVLCYVKLSGRWEAS